jgi:hypothetical protein
LQDFVVLFPEFLGAAFAKVVASASGESGGFRCADIFRDANECDVLRTAASGFGGAGDALFDAAEIIDDGHRCILHIDGPGWTRRIQVSQPPALPGVRIQQTVAKKKPPGRAGGYASRKCRRRMC